MKGLDCCLQYGWRCGFLGTGHVGVRGLAGSSTGPVGLESEGQQHCQWLAVIADSSKGAFGLSAKTAAYVQLLLRITGSITCAAETAGLLNSDAGEVAADVCTLTTGSCACCYCCRRLFLLQLPSRVAHNWASMVLSAMLGVLSCCYIADQSWAQQGGLLLPNGLQLWIDRQGVGWTAPK